MRATLPGVRRTLSLAALVLLLGGCGSSSGSNTGVVARAAADTATVPGYRIAALLTLTSSATGETAVALTGAFDRANNLAQFTTVAGAGGQPVRISEIVSGGTVYMGAEAFPNGVRLSGGKRWLKLDTTRARAAIGVTSLPSTSDPTQFIDYLRAVSTATYSKGTQLIRGVPSAHYHATIDLDRYPDLVSAAQRPSVASSVKTLESALGGHTLPVDAWIDAQGLLRRISLTFGECVANAHLTFSMTMDVFDYGPQARPRVPATRDVYDLTPVIARALRHVKLGCK